MRRAALNVARVAKSRRFYTLDHEPYSVNTFISEADRDLPARDDGSTLKGLHVGIKDNICTKDLHTTCGSWGLRDYVSPFDATVVSKLRDFGLVIAGKTNLDEFGMGYG